MSVNFYCLYGEANTYFTEIHVSKICKVDDRFDIDQQKEFSRPIKEKRFDNKLYRLYHFELPASKKHKEIYLGIYSDKRVYYQSIEPVTKLEEISEKINFIFGLEFEIKTESYIWNQPPGLSIKDPIEEVKVLFEFFYKDTEEFKSLLEQFFQEKAPKLKHDQKKNLFYWIVESRDNSDEEKKVMKALFFYCLSLSEILKFSKNHLEPIEYIATRFYDFSEKSKKTQKSGFIDAMSNVVKKVFFFSNIKMREEFIPYIQVINQKLLGVCLLLKESSFLEICKDTKKERFLDFFFKNLVKEINDDVKFKESSLFFKECLKRNHFDLLMKNSPELVDLIKSLLKNKYSAKNSLDVFLMAFKENCGKITKDGKELTKLKATVIELANPENIEVLNIILDIIFRDFSEENHTFRNLLEFFDLFLREDMTIYGFSGSFQNDQKLKEKMLSNLVKIFVNESPLSLGNLARLQELNDQYPETYEEAVKEILIIPDVEKEIIQLIKSRRCEFKDKIQILIRNKLYEKDNTLWTEIINTPGCSLQLLWKEVTEKLTQREAKNQLVNCILIELMDKNSPVDFFQFCSKFQQEGFNIERHFTEFFKRKQTKENSVEFLRFSYKTADQYPEFSDLIINYFSGKYKSEDSDASLAEVLRSFLSHEIKSENTINLINFILEKNLKFILKPEDILKSSERTRKHDIASTLKKIQERMVKERKKFENRYLKSLFDLTASLRTRILNKDLNYEELFCMSNFPQSLRQERLILINIGTNDEKEKITDSYITDLLLFFKEYSENIKTIEVFSSTFLKQFTFREESLFKIEKFTNDFKSINISSFIFPEYLKHLLEVAKFIEATHQSIFFQKIISAMKSE